MLAFQACFQDMISAAEGRHSTGFLWAGNCCSPYVVLLPCALSRGYRGSDVVHTTRIARVGCVDDIFAMAMHPNAYGVFLLEISFLRCFRSSEIVTWRVVYHWLS